MSDDSKMPRWVELWIYGLMMMVISVLVLGLCWAMVEGLAALYNR